MKKPSNSATVKATARRRIEVMFPGQTQPLRIERVVFDFNGTLAVDGKLVRGVGPRIAKLARRIDVVVMTADTFGTARRVFGSLPVTLHIVRDGADKRRYLRSVGCATCAAVGNGVNDVPMLEAAALGIVVCGREGAATEAVRVATIVVLDVNDAIDLLLNPKRLIATLRR